MMRPVLAVALLAVMAGAWYWALGSVAPSLARPRSAESLPPSPLHVPVPVVRLDHLAAQAVTRPVPGDWRNPFRDGTPAPSDTGPAVSVSTRTTPGVAATPVGPAAPVWPRLELIGLAETSHDGGLVRTAIVSGAQGVLHARPGDVLLGVYRLERIGVDGVEVRLLPEDRIIRFPLRR